MWIRLLWRIMRADIQLKNLRLFVAHVGPEFGASHACLPRAPFVTLPRACCNRNANARPEYNNRRLQSLALHSSTDLPP